MSNYATGPDGEMIRLEIVEGLNCPECGGSLGGEMWVNEDVFICIDCSKEYNIEIQVLEVQE